MSNRRQRRSQAPTPTTSTTIPHTRAADDPRNSRRPTKTLLELASERQLLSSHLPPDAKLTSSNVVNVTISPSGEVRTLDGSPLPAGLSSTTDADGNVVASPTTTTTTTPNDDNDMLIEEDIDPRLDTLLLSISLSAVHFTLSVLTMHQYAQALVFRPLIVQTLFIAFPTLTLLIHFFRGHLLPSIPLSNTTANAIRVLRSVLYLLIANVAGCYLLMLSNDRGYYAVMKKAPGVGTLWVWAVLEMGLFGALGGVAGPAGYAWWKGYGL